MDPKSQLNCVVVAFVVQWTPNHISRLNWLESIYKMITTVILLFITWTKDETSDFDDCCEILEYQSAWFLLLSVVHSVLSAPAYLLPENISKRLCIARTVGGSEGRARKRRVTTALSLWQVISISPEPFIPFLSSIPNTAIQMLRIEYRIDSSSEWLGTITCTSPETTTKIGWRWETMHIWEEVIHSPEEIDTSLRHVSSPSRK